MNSHHRRLPASRAHKTMRHANTGDDLVGLLAIENGQNQLQNDSPGNRSPIHSPQVGRKRGDDAEEEHDSGQGLPAQANAVIAHDIGDRGNRRKSTPRIPNRHESGVGGKKMNLRRGFGLFDGRFERLGLLH